MEGNAALSQTLSAADVNGWFDGPMRWVQLTLVETIQPSIWLIHYLTPARGRGDAERRRERSPSSSQCLAW